MNEMKHAVSSGGEADSHFWLSAEQIPITLNKSYITIYFSRLKASLLVICGGENISEPSPSLTQTAQPITLLFSHYDLHSAFCCGFLRRFNNAEQKANHKMTIKHLIRKTKPPLRVTDMKPEVTQRFFLRMINAITINQSDSQWTITIRAYEYGSGSRFLFK